MRKKATGIGGEVAGAATVAEPKAEKPSFSLISNEMLLQIYATMVKCRMLEERVRALPAKSRDGGALLVSRQEANVVGAAIDLETEDAISPANGDFIAGFVKGVPLATLLRRLAGQAKNTSNDQPSQRKTEDGSYGVIPPARNTFAQLSIAAGVALAHTMRRDGKVVVAFLRECRNEESLWLDSLKFAGTHRLPIIIVCQASSAAAGARPANKKEEGLAAKADACGVPGMVVDGHDVVAVYRVAHEGISRARKGRGPTLIECTPYRSGSRAKSSRSKTHDEETEEDPIAKMETYLTRKGLFTEGLKEEIAAQFEKELSAAIAAAK